MSHACVRMLRQAGTETFESKTHSFIITGVWQERVANLKTDYEMQEIRYIKQTEEHKNFKGEIKHLRKQVKDWTAMKDIVSPRPDWKRLREYLPGRLSLLSNYICAKGSSSHLFCGVSNIQGCASMPRNGHGSSQNALL